MTAAWKFAPTSWRQSPTPNSRVGEISRADLERCMIEGAALMEGRDPAAMRATAQEGLDGTWHVLVVGYSERTRPEARPNSSSPTDPSDRRRLSARGAFSASFNVAACVFLLSGPPYRRRADPIVSPQAGGVCRSSGLNSRQPSVPLVLSLFRPKRSLLSLRAKIVRKSASALSFSRTPSSARSRIHYADKTKTRNVLPGLRHFN